MLNIYNKISINLWLHQVILMKLDNSFLNSQLQSGFQVMKYCYVIAILAFIIILSHACTENLPSVTHRVIPNAFPFSSTRDLSLMITLSNAP